MELSVITQDLSKDIIFKPINWRFNQWYTFRNCNVKVTSVYVIPPVGFYDYLLFSKKSAIKHARHALYNLQSLMYCTMSYQI